MKNPKSEIRNSKFISGAAIMLALWALFLLSALIISWALDINTRLSISGEGMRMLRAEAAACSGAEIALHPKTEPYSDNLRGTISGDAKYEAHVTGEGGRLQINYLCGAAGEAGTELLKNYLTIKGVDLNARDTMIDSLLDWVQPNTGLHRLNAPPESDTYHPPHLPLDRVDDMKKIAGWGDFTSHAGWDDDFTVVRNISKIDLQWASRNVLESLPGITPNMVDRFLQIRQGPDGVDGTADDTQFKSISDAASAFGLRQEQLEALNNLVIVRSNVFRVVSVGTVGNSTRTVQMIFSKIGSNGVTGNAPTVFSWKEF